MQKLIATEADFHKTYGFKCNGCGKCCTSAPALSLDEVYKYKDVFIPRVRFDVTNLLNATRGLPEKIKAEVIETMKQRFTIAERSSSSGDFDLKEHFAISIQIAPIDYHVNDRCMMLRDDNRCELHLQNNKPQICQVVPFSTFMPEATLPVKLQDARQSYCTQIFENPSSDDNCEIIFRDGKVNFDSELGKALRMNQVSCSKDQPILGTMVEMLSNIGLIHEDFYQHVMDTLQDGGDLTISFTSLLMCFTGFLETDASELVPNGFTKETIPIFCQSQISLIDKEIAKALKRKNRNERSITAELRSIRQDYINFQNTISQ